MSVLLSLTKKMIIVQDSVTVKDLAVEVHLNTSVD